MAKRAPASRSRGFTPFTARAIEVTKAMSRFGPPKLRLVALSTGSPTMRSSLPSGEKLDEIYVTSMARVKHPAVHDRFAKEAKPQFLAGSLFRITGLGIRGLPEPRFEG